MSSDLVLSGLYPPVLMERDPLQQTSSVVSDTNQGQFAFFSAVKWQTDVKPTQIAMSMTQMVTLAVATPFMRSSTFRETMGT